MEPRSAYRVSHRIISDIFNFIVLCEYEVTLQKKLMRGLYILSLLLASVTGYYLSIPKLDRNDTYLCLGLDTGNVLLDFVSKNERQSE